MILIPQPIFYFPQPEVGEIVFQTRRVVMIIEYTCSNVPNHEVVALTYHPPIAQFSPFPHIPILQSFFAFLY
jgi:hypothetical protein